MQHSTERHTLRNRLLNNGYLPLPAADKGVYIEGWSRVEITAQWLAYYHRNGRYQNTGLRCDRLLAFDIDVLDEALADACEALIERSCGETEFCRVGQWPKRLLLYRLGEGIDAIRSARTGLYGEHMVELLASHGRQFVAYGTHPGTGTAYEWEGKDNPLDTPFDRVPILDPDTALTALDEVGALLAGTGLPQLRQPHQRGVTGTILYDLLPTTPVEYEGTRMAWADLAPTLTRAGGFGNLYRDEYGDWGDSDAIHYYRSSGSNLPCAHDFVHDCTHYESLFSPDLAALLPPLPSATQAIVDRTAFDLNDMRNNCVILRNSTVRRIDDPLHEYPLSGFCQGMQHVQVRDPLRPGQMIPFTRQWQKDPATLRADQVALRPDYPDEVIVKLDSTHIFNTYRRPAHRISEGGETGTFFDFAEHLIPGEFDRTLFLDWLANKVANPGHRMHGMVMVTPSYGTGRGILANIIGKLLIPRYVNPVGVLDLIGKGNGGFNAYLADSLIVVLEEAYVPLDTVTRWHARKMAYEGLKEVCDPLTREMHINRKYGSKNSERVFASILIQSNHLDALAIEPEDRRLIVIDNTRMPLVNAENKLYERIVNWKEDSRNIGCLYRALQARAPGIAYKPFSTPPMTAAKLRMIAAGQSDLDMLFNEFVEEAIGAIVSPGQWRGYVNKARMNRELDLPMDMNKRDYVINGILASRGQRIACLCPNNTMKIDGEVIRPWVIRDFERWQNCEDREAIRIELLTNGDPGGRSISLPIRDE